MNSHKNARVIGLISDTHGLLREEALRALRGVDLILHAGDVGETQILRRLRALAPLVAVRGNVDTEAWADELPTTAAVEAGPASLYLLHNLQQLDLNPSAAGFHVIVSGHSHQPSRAKRDGVLYLNPGSAGPRRFHLPVTVAVLDMGVVPWKVAFVDLLSGSQWEGMARASS